MRMPVHADPRWVHQRPGLRHIELLGDAHDITRINVERFLDGIGDAFELGELEDVEILRDVVHLILHHRQILQERHLLV